MATNPSAVTSLRPQYDFPVPSLTDEFNSRGLVYQRIPEGSRVLDVGCDTGRFGQVLRQEKACVVHGVEAFVAAAEQARDHLDQVFVQTIKDESSFDPLWDYDVILFLDVLEHLQDPWAVLRGTYQALKPGGLLQLVVPNVAHLAVVKRLLMGRFDYAQHGTMDRTHLRWFTRSSLRNLLAESGFEQIEIQVTPAVPKLHKNRTVDRWILKQLTRLWPDQVGGSIVGRAVRPAQKPTRE